jgi:hypothetical protein
MDTQKNPFFVSTLNVVFLKAHIKFTNNFHANFQNFWTRPF